MEVWNTLGESVGKSLHNKIFMAMLTGYMSVTFSAGAANNGGNAVPVIKCSRQYTGVGLKEAKDYWDASKITSQTIKVAKTDIAREFRDDLRKLGCIVF
jgi:ribosomal protein L7/L12